MNKQNFLEALKNNNINEYEIHDNDHLIPPQLLIIVNREEDKKFVEKYLYENLEAMFDRKVILKT